MLFLPFSGYIKFLWQKNSICKKISICYWKFGNFSFPMCWYILLYKRKIIGKNKMVIFFCTYWFRIKISLITMKMVLITLTDDWIRSAKSIYFIRERLFSKIFNMISLSKGLFLIQFLQNKINILHYKCNKSTKTHRNEFHRSLWQSS